MADGQGTTGRDTVAESDTAARERLSTGPDQTPETESPAGVSFGGARGPGARGALAWAGREASGWARWTWRQLTSMRIALILLFLLALGSIPGSLIPQEDASPVAVARMRGESPALAGVYDALGLFDVYSSAWFSAIYILLFVSLIGCIVPRTGQFLGQLRARPPRAPRRLTRMPAYTTWRTEAAPGAVLDAADGLLRRRRFRVDRGEGAVAAEKGYLREAGNLVFHIALVVMLVAFAAGQLYRSEGGKLVVVGGGFTNTLTQYDDFSAGALFDVDGLERFGFDLDAFHAEFSREGPDLGTPTEFRADVTYWTGADDPGTEASIEVNHPLSVGSAKIYLIGHGFAPVVTVTDGQGDTAFTGPVPFLPQDQAGSATGVIKVTEYRDGAGEKDQLGFTGFFNPTYAVDAVRGPHSTFPEPDFPVLTLTAFHGSLGLDSGIPQNIYQLDTSDMEQFTDAATGEPLRQDLLPGEAWDLPDGGTLTFEGIERWASFQISTPAANGWALTGSVAAVFGLAASLLIQRRRIWVRAATGPDGVTVVEMASLGRTESARVPEELGALAGALQPAAPMIPDADADADADAGSSTEPGSETDTEAEPEEPREGAVP